MQLLLVQRQASFQLDRICLCNSLYLLHFQVPLSLLSYRVSNCVHKLGRIPDHRGCGTLDWQGSFKPNLRTCLGPGLN